MIQKSRLHHKVGLTYEPWRPWIWWTYLLSFWVWIAAMVNKSWGISFAWCINKMLRWKRHKIKVLGIIFWILFGTFVELTFTQHFAHIFHDKSLNREIGSGPQANSFVNGLKHFSRSIFNILKTKRCKCIYILIFNVSI